ncbi:voltage-dependent T-type calcium channel subunit alpha-1G isoform X7 [Silurus asotus]|uniref:Voltage-dependent T-type calcium channel subunit alpha-1G isoform X7 n=1 Tax=Silurus asotus TaxID=30991 RepID=A0AAD5ATY1_SILAS|nr:voltage-dependent T-type calcium channel subunit alpha-1G isoform X7 [Silurus asotus]
MSTIEVSDYLSHGPNRVDCNLFSIISQVVSVVLGFSSTPMPVGGLARLKLPQDFSGRRSIMTDGEGRERFQYLESGEVRVPVSVLYQAHGHGQSVEDEEKDSTWGPDVFEGSNSSETRASADGSGGGGDAPAPDGASEEQEQQPYPALAPIVFFCIKQTTRPRSWCLRVVCNPYP